MKRNLVFLAVIVLLYLVPSLVLQAVYGDSYGFWEGSDCWAPDGSGGWTKQGNPSYPMPTIPSVEVPLVWQYVPIFLPAMFLFLFLLTPLSRMLEPKPSEMKDDVPPEAE